jgi:hypothetical protein
MPFIVSGFVIGCNKDAIVLLLFAVEGEEQRLNAVKAPAAVGRS